MLREAQSVIRNNVAKVPIAEEDGPNCRKVLERNEHTVFLRYADRLSSTVDRATSDTAFCCIVCGLNLQ